LGWRDQGPFPYPAPTVTGTLAVCAHRDEHQVGDRCAPSSHRWCGAAGRPWPGSAVSPAWPWWSTRSFGAYLVAAGLLGHAAWDADHYRANRVVVRSMAEFCLVLDTALAVAIVALQIPWLP
jgi:hypothetical protein